MSFFVGVLVYMTITLVALFIYFPLVWLNVVFTFNYLPASAVPYYNSGIATTEGLPQYGWTWWSLALDLFRFIPIFYLFIVLSIPKRYSPKIDPKDKRVQLNLGWNILLAILAVIEAVKAVMFGFMAINSLSNFANCFDITTSCTNYIFWMAFWYSIAFLLWDIIWIFLLGSSIQRYVLEEEKEK